MIAGSRTRQIACFSTVRSLSFRIVAISLFRLPAAIHLTT
jgi:hypothetical protein